MLHEDLCLYLYNVYHHGLASWSEDQEEAIPCQLQAHLWQVDPVATATAEGLVWGWWHSIVVPLLIPFDFKSSPVGVFRGDNMVGGQMSGITVLNLSG